jgi:hypothetical protein
MNQVNTPTSRYDGVNAARKGDMTTALKVDFRPVLSWARPISAINVAMVAVCCPVSRTRCGAVAQKGGDKFATIDTHSVLRTEADSAAVFGVVMPAWGRRSLSICREAFVVVVGLGLWVVGRR